MNSDSRLPVQTITPSLPAPENKLYFPALDGIRAVGVLMVFFQHYEAALFPRLAWGWAGVDIFFVLSGFLITGILYDTRSSPTRLRDFFLRRMLRIFPLYYGVLLAAAALTPVFHWLWNPAWILWFTYLGNYARFIYLGSPLMDLLAVEHLRSLTMQPVFILFTGHFWSLCVEEQFYLFWPLVVYSVVKRATLRNICILIVVLDLAARILCTRLLSPALLGANFLTRFTPLRLDALLLGALAALLMRGPHARRMPALAASGVLVFTAGFALWQILYRLRAGTHHIYQPDMAGPILTTYGFTLIDIFAALVILAVLRPKGLLYRFLTLTPLRRLGKISYGFYVFHDLLHDVYRALARHIVTAPVPWQHVTALIGLVFTILIAELSYRFYEQPFLRLKRFFTPPPRPSKTGLHEVHGGSSQGA